MPTISSTDLTKSGKKKNIEKLARQILNTIGIAWTDSTEETPKRIANMLIDELLIGLDKSNFPKYKMFNINNKQCEPVIVENISVFSICEHHFLPFIGKATFKYLPKNKIIGLSKIPRIIDFLSRKPQVQERLTIEIFNKFKEILKTEDISISLTCEHFCTKMRGIKDNCVMTTSKSGGIFKKNNKQ